MAEFDIPGKKTTPATDTKCSNKVTGIGNKNDNEFFSPTSAAAWALSTLHNFGAAAPIENTQRPTTDTLTCTRLFNNGTSSTLNVDLVSNKKAVNDAIKDSNESTNSTVTTTSVTKCLNQTKVLATNTTAAVSWGQMDFQDHSVS